MGNAAGALKAAATRVGLTVQEYTTRIDGGEKWCTGCKEWHRIDEFPRDRTRGDGRRARCLKVERGKPRSTRDPLHEAARKAVSYEIRCGRMPPANAMPCTDCGHLSDDKRHEYDHHRGYEREHHLDVEPVCTTCHADRERSRRTAA